MVILQANCPGFFSCVEGRGYRLGGCEFETMTSRYVEWSCPYVKIAWDGGRQLPDLQSNLCSKVGESFELGEHRNSRRGRLERLRRR